MLTHVDSVDYLSFPIWFPTLKFFEVLRESMAVVIILEKTSEIKIKIKGENHTFLIFYCFSSICV